MIHLMAWLVASVVAGPVGVFCTCPSQSCQPTEGREGGVVRDQDVISGDCHEQLDFELDIVQENGEIGLLSQCRISKQLVFAC